MRFGVLITAAGMSSRMGQFKPMLSIGSISVSQRYLGLLWLGQVLYPEYVEYALQEEVTEYYRLFYNCELTDEMYRALMENSLP